jgi:hypothetical protein
MCPPILRICGHNIVIPVEAIIAAMLGTSKKVKILRSNKEHKMNENKTERLKMEIE